MAASTGFIDGWGYIGSVIIGMLVPFILDMTGSWSIVFYLWGAIAFVIVGLVVAVHVKTLNSRKEKIDVVAKVQ